MHIEQSRLLVYCHWSGQVVHKVEVRDTLHVINDSGQGSD